MDKKEIIIDIENKSVQFFIDGLEKSKQDPKRKRKMDELREDCIIYDNQFAGLPTNGDDPDHYNETLDVEAPPLMKSSLYQNFFNAYEIEGNMIPRCAPVKEGMPEADIAIIDSFKDQIRKDSGFEQIYTDDVFDKFKYEGCPFVQIGTNEDEVMFDSPALQEMYVDPDARVLQSRFDSKYKAKWIVRAIEVSEDTFNNFLIKMGHEDKIGKIAYGNPVPIDQVNSVYYEDLYKTSDTKKYGLVYGYKLGDESEYIIFAGKSATVLKHLEGKNYPFQKKERGKWVDILPYNMFHFSSTRYREGLYSQSMIGLIKDGVEALKKFLNHLLPNGIKAVNGYLALFGDTEARTLEDMKVYTALQNQGFTPIIQSSDPNTSMNFISPDISRMYSAYESMRRIILDDLGARVRHNFRLQEDVEQTATEFVGKIGQQNAQISGLNKNNKSVFEWIDECLVSFAQKFKPKKKNTKFYFGLDLGDEVKNFELNYETVMAVLDSFDGVFECDPAIRTPMSHADKREAINQTMNRLVSLLQGMNYTSEAQIMPIVRLMYREIVMNELENEVSMNDLSRMARDIINQRNPQNQVAPTGSEKIAFKEEEIQQNPELSPLTFLANAT